MTLLPLLLLSLQPVPVAPVPSTVAAAPSPAPAPPPPWVQRIVVTEKTAPPADKCETAAKPVTPGVVMPPEPPKPPDPNRPEPLPEQPPLKISLVPGADNSAVPAEVLARASTPVDLATLPLEPLRGEAKDLAELRDVLASARQRTVRLSFWGASHVAGEYFTGEIRRILQDRSADLGHGFTMPAAPWKGYRGTDINLCSGGEWVTDHDRRKEGREDGRFGISGVSIESSSPESFGWIQTTTSNPHGRAVTYFDVAFMRQTGGGTLTLLVDDTLGFDVNTAGSIGPGGVRLELPDGPHRLRVRPKGDGPVRLLGAWMERPGAGTLVDAMGVSGRTASSWLRWDAALFTAMLEWKPPEVAVLAYGTNEAASDDLHPETYRKTLSDVLTRFRTWMPDTPCVLIGPSDRAVKVKGGAWQVWERTSPIARVQQELAPRYGCLSWDLQAVTGGLGSALGWWIHQPKLMTDDLIHFTGEGYKELARRFVEAASGQPAPPRE